MKAILCAALVLSIISYQAAFAANTQTSSRGDSSNQANTGATTSEQVSAQKGSGKDPETVKLEQRLAQLKSELAAGQKVLAELAAKAANTRQTLQRVSDAIKILEAELAKSNTPQK
jgi:uncharacterized coiled-coil protein SlyX